jgi:hypothetical protein
MSEISVCGNRKKEFVRKGIWTPALIRGPEISRLRIMKEGLNLESGALDHSAILTYNTLFKIQFM